MFILFTLVCVAFQLMANASNTQEIKGIVIDKITGIPLQGVTISVSDTKIPIGTITDEKGEFRLWDIPLNMNLIFSLDGYKVVSLDPVNGHTSDDSSFIIELENKTDTKKKSFIGNLLKNRKTEDKLVVFSE